MVDLCPLTVLIELVKEKLVLVATTYNIFLTHFANFFSCSKV